MEYEKCLGLTSILKEASNTVKESQDTRERIRALSVAKDCYGMKSELLTNVTVVDEAIKFVSTHKTHGRDSKVNENNNSAISNCIYEKVQSFNTYNTVFE